MFLQRERNAPRARPTAELVLRKGDSILLVESRDLVTKEAYYRPPGSAIPFGQYAAQTIQSTVAEFIGHAVRDVRYFGTLESLYRRHGRREHDVAIIFTGQFAKAASYDVDVFYIRSNAETAQGRWYTIDGFANAAESLQPNGLYALLDQQWDGVPTP